MEDDILEQDEDLLDEEMKEPEDVKPQSSKDNKIESEEVTETYEAFEQAPRLGIMNTLTGEVIDGFDSERDKALVQLGKIILNKLDRIGIAQGI